MTTQFGKKSTTGGGFGGRGAEREKLLFIGAAGLAAALLIILVVVFQLKTDEPAPSAQVAVLPEVANTVMLLTPEVTVRSGSKLSDVRLKEIPWPVNQVPEDAVRNPGEVRNLFARVDIQAGVPLQKSHVTEDEAEVSLPLTPGNRAVTLQVDEVSSIENHAKPGTRVDVVLTYYVNSELTSKVIVQNARVLSLGGETAPAFRGGRGPTGRGQSTITLDVAPNDALQVQTAKKLGTLSLMLRSSDDYQPLDKLEVDTAQIEGDRRKQPEAQPECKKGTVRVGGQEFIMNCDGSIAPAKRK
jgi:pilus assembly protein CpaB